MTSWMAQRNAFTFNPKCLDPWPDARRLEGGSPPIPGIYLGGLRSNLLAGIGMENVAAQIERLTGAFLKGVRDVRIDCKPRRRVWGRWWCSALKMPSRCWPKLSERGIAVSTRRGGERHQKGSG
jgi:hypothetical protein